MRIEKGGGAAVRGRKRIKREEDMEETGVRSRVIGSGCGCGPARW